MWLHKVYIHTRMFLHLYNKHPESRIVRSHVQYTGGGVESSEDIYGGGEDAPAGFPAV